VIGRKGLAALVVLTVVVGVAAWALRARSLPAAPELPERFVPGLSEQINELTAVTVAGHDEQFTLRRTGETWGLEQKDGHPVRFEKLKGLVVGLSELRPLEKKTASPSLHSKLGLLAPSAEGSTSVEVTLLGAGGAPVADVIVGNPGPAARTRYVRRADEDQTWLVQGDLNLVASLQQWLDTEVMRLEPAAVSRVTVTHPDGEVLVVAKDAKDDPVWTIADVPEGSEPKSAGIGSTVAGALQWLDFDDVAAASGHPLPEADRVTTVFETWDGLRVTVTAAREPAPAQEPGAAGEDAPETPPDAAGDAEAEPEPTEWLALTVEAGDSATDEARQQAATLNARVSPWVYKVGKYKASTLRQRLADVTQPKPAEAPKPAEEPAEPVASPESEQPAPPASGSDG
jgi:hypothetical protein